MGLDRIDYTKGIPDRLRALDRFLERYPDYRNRVVFIQTGVPSRVHVPAYRRINDEIDSLIDEVNWKYESDHWKPIIDLRGPLSPLTVMALRRLANFAVVSSLHDGMNLVAKEFVASAVDDDKVLILSQFTGAARELTDALLVNPYATDHFAEAIKEALEMPADGKAASDAPDAGRSSGEQRLQVGSRHSDRDGEARVRRVNGASLLRVARDCRSASGQLIRSCS